MKWLVRRLEGSIERFVKFMRIPSPGAIIGADPWRVVCLVLSCSFSQIQSLRVANEAVESSLVEI